MDFYQIPGDKIIQINLKHCHPLTKKTNKTKIRDSHEEQDCFQNHAKSVQKQMRPFSFMNINTDLK